MAENKNLEENIVNIVDLLWLSQYTGISAPIIENNTSTDKRKEKEESKQENTPSNNESESKQTEESKSEVHEENQDNRSEKGSKPAKPFTSPKKLALSNYREWEKAFKFVNFEKDSLTKIKLDEEKTVEWIATTGIYDLKFKKVKEKFFSLTVVIDRSETMELWGELIENFKKILYTQGVYNSINIYYLDTKDIEAKLYYDKILKQKAHFRQITTDGIYNQIWVLTDCLASSWESGDAFKLINIWSRYSFTSIVQMFPKQMWYGTMLYQAKQTRFSSKIFNPLNKNLVKKSKRKSRNSSLLKIPVVVFNPYALQSWARVSTNRKNNIISGVEFFTFEFNHQNVEQSEVDIDERMSRFSSQASKPAQRLAKYMSVLPVDYKIARMIQEIKFKDEKEQSHIAEVFLGGLIEKRKQNEKVKYDFYPHVRERLQEHLPAYDAKEILEEISSFVSSHLGIGFDFNALIEDPNGIFDGDITISDDSIAFAKLASDVLKRLSGKELDIANKIDKSVLKVSENSSSSLVDIQSSKDKGISELEKLRASHKIFAKSRQKIYIPHKKNESILDKFIESDQDKLLLYGESGLGKSALIANYFEQFKKKSDIFVIEHYIEAGELSNDFQQILLRVMLEIKDEFELSDKVPSEPQKIVDEFALWLHRVKRPTVIVLDGYNQIENNLKERIFYYIPEKLEKVKLIFTSTEDSYSIENKYKIEALNTKEKQELIVSYFNNYGKKISQEVIQQILNHTQTDNMLFLTILLDEVEVLGNYETYKDDIKNYLDAKNIVELFIKVFERLEKNYNEHFVRQKLVYSFLDNNSIFLNLEKYLIERNGIYKFNNPYIKEAVKQKYLNSSNQILITFENEIRYRAYNEVTLTQIPNAFMALNKSEELAEYLKDIVDYLVEYLKDRYPKAMSSPHTYENTDMYLSKDVQVQLIMNAIKVLPIDIAKKYLEKQFIDKLEAYMYAPANKGAFDDRPLLYSLVLISLILPKYNEWLFLYLKRISNYLENFFQSQASLEFDGNGYIKVSIFIEVIKTLVKTKLKIKKFPSWIPDFLERFKKVAISEVGVEKRNLGYKQYYDLNYSNINQELTLKEALNNVLKSKETIELEENNSSSYEFSKKYKAFISYSHSDEAFGSWLHKELEKYKIPKKLREDYPNLPQNLYPIFRDRYEISAGDNLGEVISEATKKSDALIIVCSLKSAQSKWVNKEIIEFKMEHGEDRIFPIIIEGIPFAKENEKYDDSLECFPDALKYKIDSEGQLTYIRTDILAIDINNNEDGKELAKLKLIAGILGITINDLYIQENKKTFLGQGFDMLKNVFTSEIDNEVENNPTLEKNENLKTRWWGDWERESDTGNLFIYEVNKDGFKFNLDVVNEYHLGSIENKYAKIISENEAIFEEKKTSDYEPCQITFKKSEEMIEIIENNCSQFHGMKAYFDGIYHLRKDIFISYSSKEKDTVVKPLIEALDKNNISYWSDSQDIRTGNSIVERINEGLHKSRYFLVIISDTFLSNSWTQRELITMINKEISTSGRKVLPLIVGDINKIYDILKREYPFLHSKLCLEWDNNPEDIARKLKEALDRNVYDMTTQFDIKDIKKPIIEKVNQLSILNKKETDFSSLENNRKEIFFEKNMNKKQKQVYKELVLYGSFSKYIEWVDAYKQDTTYIYEYIEDNFSKDIVVDKYYFYKLSFLSSSLSIDDKYKLFNAIPLLSQFQVNELLKVFEEEIDKFKILYIQYSNEIEKHWNNIQIDCQNLIVKIIL